MLYMGVQFITKMLHLYLLIVDLKIKKQIILQYKLSVFFITNQFITCTHIMLTHPWQQNT